MIAGKETAKLLGDGFLLRLGLLPREPGGHKFRNLAININYI